MSKKRNPKVVLQYISSSTSNQCININFHKLLTKQDKHHLTFNCGGSQGTNYSYLILRHTRVTPLRRDNESTLYVAQDTCGDRKQPASL